MSAKLKTSLAILLIAGVFLNLLGCNASSTEEALSSEAASDVLSSGAETTESAEQNKTSSTASASGKPHQTTSSSTGTLSSAGTTQQETQSTPQTGSTGEIGTFEMKSPNINQFLTTLKPTFAWTKAPNADSYTLVLEELTASGAFQKKMEKQGITGTRYTLPNELKANRCYRWSVTAVNKTDKVTADTGFADYGNKIPFMTVDYKNHEANKGLNFTFKNTVSEEVLRNYLSRSMIADMGSETISSFYENLRMILHTGAKYIGRADISWTPSISEYIWYEEMKSNLAYAHSLDPEIVFEACIFETTSRQVEKIEIPDWVFKAFDQPVEKRCFSYDKMIFTNGRYQNQWGTGVSVPDMTRVETQMFFYYRACTYIDLGFEGLHMGQVHLMGEKDSGWNCWHKVLTKIREYAKTHARRGFVFINAHTHGIKGPDGKLLFDFHSYPYRNVAPEGSVAHPPTKDNPQITELRVGYGNSIYKKSMGGTTYSGWSCDSLPYFVELDNSSGYGDCSGINQPFSSIWGGDEITWFANQPQWYRHQWLQYAYSWARKNDPAGYAQMPGNRTAALRTASGYQQLTYYCNNSQFHKDGFNDEACIRQIWVNDRKSK